MARVCSAIQASIYLNSTKTCSRLPGSVGVPTLLAGVEICLMMVVVGVEIVGAAGLVVGVAMDGVAGLVVGVAIVCVTKV